MKIIPRYILRMFFPIGAVVVSAFGGLYLVIDFFERVDDFIEEQVSFGDTFQYFLYKLPTILTQGIPVSVLLGVMITLGILSRNREIIALKAAGVSAFTIAKPLLLGALFIAVLHFSLAETLARFTGSQAQQIWDQEVKKKKSTVSWSLENGWFRGQGVLYQIGHYDRGKKVMVKPSLFFVDEQFRLTRRIDAGCLRWNEGVWVAENGLVLRFDQETTCQERFSAMELPLEEKPEDFEVMERIPEQLDWFDLVRYAEKVRREGYNAVPYEVELQLRLAVPFTTFVLALLGVAVAFRQGLHGGIAAGVGIAVVMAAVYLVIFQMGVALATAGILSPLPGVWIGNALFAWVACYLWIGNPKQ